MQMSRQQLRCTFKQDMRMSSLGSTGTEKLLQQSLRLHSRLRRTSSTSWQESFEADKLGDRTKDIVADLLYLKLLVEEYNDAPRNPTANSLRIILVAFRLSVIGSGTHQSH
mmetsp:Transcript_26977/g.88210  ORF Transcript_26977/g.88210 Transcript_26977/m.88210 type:complete len:111 (-) Transcript_26977:4-336(-)